MPKQKPKADHPWRQYKNRIVPRKEEKSEFISVEQFIFELSQTYSARDAILNVSFEGTKQHKLKNLPQSKQAAYIAGVLKRNYM